MLTNSKFLLYLLLSTFLLCHVVRSQDDSNTNEDTGEEGAFDDLEFEDEGGLQNETFSDEDDVDDDNFDKRAVNGTGETC